MSPTSAARAIGGGRVLEWIDKAAYAYAVGWSGGYCVTAHVGDITFARPIHSGDLVEVRARLAHTGRTSMHIVVTVTSTRPDHLHYTFATSCTVVFIAADSTGRPTPVPAWNPHTAEDINLQDAAATRITVGSDITSAMAAETYTDVGTAPTATLRFLAAPTDVNWGGKTHGGTVMRWIDEAAYVCATNWSRRALLPADPHRTPRRGSGPAPAHRQEQHAHLRARPVWRSDRLTHASDHPLLHRLAALDDQRRPTQVPRWVPRTDEDHRLNKHAEHLIVLRSRLAPAHPA